jgi:5-methylcytosine-specific restriction endonuclease McrA
MSTKRAWTMQDSLPVKRQGETERHCRFCGGAVVRPRLTFCSQKCVDQWTLRTRPAEARRQVELRDRGVCAVCGVDTQQIERLAKRLYLLANGAWRIAYGGVRTSVGVDDTALGTRLLCWHRYPSAAKAAMWLDWLQHMCLWWFGYWVYVHHDGLTPHLWEADHIVPVVEGGGASRDADPLVNLRTLCRHCHKAETRVLAARRAKASRKQKELFEP